MNRCLIFLCCVLLFQPFCFAQKLNTDSLKRIIQSATANDTLKLAALNNWGESVYSNYPDSALALFEKARQLVEIKLKTANAAEKKVLQKYYAESISNIGSIFYYKGDVKKGIEYFDWALKLREEINYKQGIGYSLNNLAYVYSQSGDYDNALIFFNRSLDIYKELKLDNKIAESYNNIGFSYQNKGDYTQAKQYFYQSLALRVSQKNKKGIATCYNNIGGLFKLQHMPDSAIYYFNKSLIIRKEINDLPSIANGLLNLSGSYIDKKEYQKALPLSEEGYKLANTLHFATYIKSAADNLRIIYKELGRPKEALEMYELFIKMRDSIMNEETKKTSIKSQLKYEYEKKAAADSVRVEKEKEITTAQLQKEQTQRYALYGGLLLTLVFGAFVYNRLRVTNKQKHIIEKQKHVVEEKQKEILDSIRYAKRIQNSLLPTEKYVERKLKELKK